MPFSTETEALAWLGGLRRRGERLNATDPRVLEVLYEAVRYVGTLRFDDAPIERLLIAEASGLLPELVDDLLDEIG